MGKVSQPPQTTLTLSCGFILTIRYCYSIWSDFFFSPFDKDMAYQQFDPCLEEGFSSLNMRQRAAVFLDFLERCFLKSGPCPCRCQVLVEGMHTPGFEGYHLCKQSSVTSGKFNPWDYEA